METITKKRNDRRFNILFWVIFLLLPWLNYFFGIDSFTKTLIKSVFWFIIMFIPLYLLFKYKSQWFKTYLCVGKNNDKQGNNVKIRVVELFLLIIILLLPWIGYFYGSFSLENAVSIMQSMLGVGLVFAYFCNKVKAF